MADWGLGQFIHQHSKVLDLTRGGPMGTGYYCSIEQWASGRCEVTGDVYSLGVTLAEVAAGRALSINPIGAGIREDTVPARTTSHQRFNDTIRRMTSLVAAARHQSMLDVSRALASI